MVYFTFSKLELESGMIVGIVIIALLTAICSIIMIVAAVYCCTGVIGHQDNDRAVSNAAPNGEYSREMESNTRRCFPAKRS